MGQERTIQTKQLDPQPEGIMLCYVTDRRQFPGTPQDQERLLLEKIAECAAAAVDFVQLREKDLSTRALETLAHKAVAAIPNSSPSRLLINSRTDVALACGAHGVHLPASDLPASEVRAICESAGKAGMVIGVSAHSAEEASRAESLGADFVLFAPVFEKNDLKNLSGLEQLRQACQQTGCAGAGGGTMMPVLALGGVSVANAKSCLDAGTAGIAGIRLFQQNDVQMLAGKLRALRG